MPPAKQESTEDKIEHLLERLEVALDRAEQKIVRAGEPKKPSKSEGRSPWMS